MKPIVILACQDFSTEMKHEGFMEFWQQVHDKVQTAQTRYVIVSFTRDNGWFVIGTNDPVGEYNYAFANPELS